MTDLKQIFVTRETVLSDALKCLDTAGGGILLLVDDQDLFERTVTDGDIRRLLIADGSLDSRLELLPHIK